MNIAPQKKLWIVIVSFAVVVLILVPMTPFLVGFGRGGFSKEATIAFFIILEFVAAAYLLNEFNNLRLKINKKELEDQELAELEHDVEKLSILAPKGPDKKK